MQGFIQSDLLHFSGTSGKVMVSEQQVKRLSVLQFHGYCGLLELACLSFYVLYHFEWVRPKVNVKEGRLREQ